MRLSYVIGPRFVWDNQSEPPLTDLLDAGQRHLYLYFDLGAPFSTLYEAFTIASGGARDLQ
jgi:hypothetical protein